MLLVVEEKTGLILDAYFSGTKINNEHVLRINCVNHRRNKKDVEFLFKVIKEVGQKAERFYIKN